MNQPAAKDEFRLVLGLPRQAGGNGPDRYFLEYLNIHRDRIASRRIRMILMFDNEDALPFMEAAGDLWDFRQTTLRLESPPSKYRR